MAIGRIYLADSRNLTQLGLPIASLALAAIIWIGGYTYTAFIPSPGAVWSEVTVTLSNPKSYAAIGLTFARLIAGLVLGLIAGFGFSVLAGRSQFFERVTTTYVRLTMTVPSLLVALLCLVIFGTSDLGPIATVAVIVFPFATLPMMEGVKSLDRAKVEMARVYNASWNKVIRHVALPQMAPYLFSAIRNAHALGWKVVIISELFTGTSGIGNEFNEAFDLFQLSRVIVWFFIFMAIIGLIEYGVLNPVEKWVFRWRPESTQKSIGSRRQSSYAAS